MSCGGGNRFQCGITRFDKHKLTADRPVNQQLHDENQKKLSDLLRLREEQDKGNFQTITQQNPQQYYKPWSDDKNETVKK
jgi:hypothetical protein